MKNENSIIIPKDACIRALKAMTQTMVTMADPVTGTYSGVDWAELVSTSLLAALGVLQKEVEPDDDD